MGSNIKTSTLFLIFVTFTTVAAQTFQYSRGWTNGKRAHKRDDGRDLAGNLEKILTPCQMNKLKYVLEGRPLSERPITMGSNIKTSTLFLIFVTFTTVAAQTFQYSRGWTNGKRAHKRDDGRDLAGNLEKILTPCQMNKLKYVLEGRPLSERLLVPCDYTEDEESPKRYKNDRSQDLFDSFL